MAVDEDHPTIQEQPEQDGTQKNQQQQKEEDSEEDSEEEEYFKVYDLEYLYELLRPFTMKQLRTLSEKAVEKHPVLAESWRKAEAFLKRYEVEEEEEDEEPFDRTGCLEAFVEKCVNKFPDIAETVHEQADRNPAHRKILVWSHGFGWDATPQSLISEFDKFGEIEDCEYVTDKHSGKFKCCAFILFKHWNGARKALEQPLKKIGNRRAVCKLALFAVYDCRYLDDNPGLAQQKIQAPSRSELFLPPSLIKAPVACQNRSVLKFVRNKCCCWSSHSLCGSLGVNLGEGSGATMSDDEDELQMDFSLDQSSAEGHDMMGFGLPTESERSLMERVRQELKIELKQGFKSRIEDVREEILGKRRAGKLPGDTTSVLKNWWQQHAKWPYPTEDDKAKLVEETGLQLKQINNWFINQRKRNWHSNSHSVTSLKSKRKRL